MDGGWCPVEAPATLSDPKARPAAAITEPAITGSELLNRRCSRAGLSLGDVVTAGLQHASTLVISGDVYFRGTLAHRPHPGQVDRPDLRAPPRGRPRKRRCAPATSGTPSAAGTRLTGTSPSWGSPATATCGSASASSPTTGHRAAAPLFRDG